MIQVTVFTKKCAGTVSDYDYLGVQLSGHAGFDDSGRDIICAAVSTLVFNTVNSIEVFTEDSFETEQDEESGYFSFSLSSNISTESKLLLNSLVLGLQNIEEEYGRPYIHIRFEEV